MTLLETLGHPVEDCDEPIPRAGYRCDLPLPRGEPATSPGFSRRRWPVLVIAVFIVAALAGWLVARAVQLQPSPADLPPPAPSGVASTAELFTSLYLAGTSRDAISRVSAGEPPPPSGAWVNHAAAVAVDHVDEDLWEVMVAVDSLQLHNGRYEPAPLGYYLVPVAILGDRAVALAAPARVPAPVTPVREQQDLAPVPGDQAAFARKFIELHLLGDPGSAAFLETPAGVAAFATPPYTAVLAEAVGVDTLGRVTVAAQATTASGVTHHLEYLVTLSANESGWRVAKIGSAVR